MKKKLTSGLLGIAALLMANQSSAATISVNPVVNNVVVGDTFALTVAGDFTAELGTSGGGVVLSWNDAQVQLANDIATTIALVTDSAVSNGWIIPNSNNLVVTSNSVSIEVVSFAFPSTFNIFSLDLVAVPPPSSGPINITASELSIGTGGWEGLPVDFIGATITTSPVPVPAAAWLFGSGLIGLVGIARRKTHLA